MNSYNPKYNHEVLDAELVEFSPVSRYKDFYKIYVKFKYSGVENWFMIVEHEEVYSGKNRRLGVIRKFGNQYALKDKFDFKFEIHSSQNKSNKLKIKQLFQKMK